MAKEETSEGLRRVTISMCESTYQELDQIITERGFNSRSQAISEMINQQAAEHLGKMGNPIVAGTLTLIYDESKSTLLRDLSRICREHVSEVISSQHVLLEDEHVLEVLLMQGPAKTLRDIANDLVSCKGVKSTHLTLTPHLLPPLHAARNGGTRSSKSL
jgi:CopG family transcriptional regulator, nickel-responsive regulator